MFLLLQLLVQVLAMHHKRDQETITPKQERKEAEDVNAKLWAVVDIGSNLSSLQGGVERKGDRNLAENVSDYCSKLLDVIGAQLNMPLTKQYLVKSCKPWFFLATCCKDQANLASLCSAAQISICDKAFFSGCSGLKQGIALRPAVRVRLSFLDALPVPSSNRFTILRGV